jgi:uncharacterized membrane protein
VTWVSRINNRESYLSELRTHLANLPETERTDIIRDQDEFFREAVLSGRTEADVIGSLGDPKVLAKTLIAESRLTASENATATTSVDGVRVNPASLSTQISATARAFIAILTLAPFNLIFVLGPFIALMACLFAAWVTGGAMLIAGLGAIVMVATELKGIGASTWAQISSVFLGLGITICSIAFLGLMTLATSWIAQLSVRYMRWNLDMIVERK